MAKSNFQTKSSFMSFLLVAFLLVALFTSVSVVKQKQDLRSRAQVECFVWPIFGPVSQRAESPSLQDAVNSHNCVRVRKGTYNLTGPLTLWSNKTLKGESRDETILKASGAWPNNGLEGVVQMIRNDVSGVNVSNLTIDANQISTHAIVIRGAVVDSVRAKNGKCTGITIPGPAAIVNNSIIERNGNTCPVAPPGAGIYADGTDDKSKVPPQYAPRITNNTIRDNYGPGIDINTVWNGVIQDNTITNNKGWAGVSLYSSSYWNISGNIINQPATSDYQKYHPRCAGGPNGAKSAGIFLCEDYDQNEGQPNTVTIYNTIENNRSASWYGILLIGNDEQTPYLVPRFNTIKNNNVFGSTHGCADDFKVGQWMDGANTWTNNNCSGTSNTPPSYY
ncbi:MAG: hypothetical protein UV56_C0001G0014 [Candidatus Woesebacteria bacterium GW2011_GWC1_43_10b]|uniref:Right handed beta helix domain-containing protein n=3 Tax=Candidatus Woeseibacteriota TaxID=1752722 RepID=A0A0G1C673_9BACT|nr:MAG: hypothetical protein UT24_C0007G0045 [Candidatus Woesebacteria bacterium GW2011_GWB1_39_12]KKS81072.1 MAG: hypothetical protein UV56_C0001G0014 [Candidatus Woesebacteria bacterium GW2011_GWC1_43_10b]